MSRIGRLPISVPDRVRVEIRGSHVRVNGPKGELSRSFDPDMRILQEAGQLIVQRPTDSRRHRAMHGLTRALLANMVLGVTDGYSKVLDIHGVGYRAEMQGEKLVMQLGYSHPVEIVPPPEISFEVEKGGRTITVLGIDKELVGEIAARVRRQRPPEPYKGKGIRYRGERVRRKAGKAGKVGTGA